MIFILLLSWVGFSQAIDCQNFLPADQEVCRISYQVIRKIQAVQKERRLEIDIEELEKHIRNGKLNWKDLNDDFQWAGLSHDRKAKRIFDELAKKSAKLKNIELKTTNEGVIVPPAGIIFTTGTRGGGFDSSVFLSFEEIWH